MSEQKTNPASGESEVAAMRAELNKLRARVQALEGRDSKVVDRVDSLENRIEAIEADPPSALRATIQELDGRMKRRMHKMGEAQAAALRQTK